MLISKCKRCGKEKKYNYPRVVKDYCSHVCSNYAKWEKREKGKTVVLVCETCGNNFELLESVKRAREANGNKIKYCSQKCMGLSNKKAKIVNCPICDKEFETTRNKCCSKNCSYEYIKKMGKHKKNGFWLENGYKVLYIEGNKSIKEHIKIMQDKIGRELQPNENVHHINGIKTDNRIENLQLLTKSEHSRLHRKKEVESGFLLFGRD